MVRSLKHLRFGLRSRRTRGAAGLSEVEAFSPGPGAAGPPWRSAGSGSAPGGATCKIQSGTFACMRT